MGKTFTVTNTPIIKGKGAQGIYSIDFYNENLGVAFGGDYSNPKVNRNNFMVTKDGGATWQLIHAENQPGYRSCIQFIPNTNAQGVMVSGPNGVDVSYNLGQTWQHISDESLYSFRFTKDNGGVASGKGKLTKFTLEY